MSDKTNSKTTLDEVKAFQREIKHLAEKFNAEVSAQLDEWLTAYEDIDINSTVKKKMRKIIGEEMVAQVSKESKPRAKTRKAEDKSGVLKNFFQDKKNGTKFLLSELRTAIPEDWKIPKETNMGTFFAKLLDEFATKTKEQENNGLAFYWTVNKSKHAKAL